MTEPIYVCVYCGLPCVVVWFLVSPLLENVESCETHSCQTHQEYRLILTERQETCCSISEVMNIGVCVLCCLCTCGFDVAAGGGAEQEAVGFLGLAGWRGRLWGGRNIWDTNIQVNVTDVLCKIHSYSTFLDHCIIIYSGQLIVPIGVELVQKWTLKTGVRKQQLIITRCASWLQYLGWWCHRLQFVKPKAGNNNNASVLYT